MELETGGSSKGMSEKQRECARDGEGEVTWKTVFGLLWGIARRLLIRTPANEGQGHSIHTSVLNSLHN